MQYNCSLFCKRQHASSGRHRTSPVVGPLNFGRGTRVRGRALPGLKNRRCKKKRCCRKRLTRSFRENKPPVKCRQTGFQQHLKNYMTTTTALAFTRAHAEAYHGGGRGQVSVFRTAFHFVMQSKGESLRPLSLPAAR